VANGTPITGVCRLLTSNITSITQRTIISTFFFFFIFLVFFISSSAGCKLPQQKNPPRSPYPLIFTVCKWSRW